MPLDHRISLGVQPMQVENPLNRLANVMQIRGMQDEASVRSLKMDELRRAQQETNALNEAYSGALGADGAVDRNKLMTTLAGRGMGSRIPGLQKQFAEVDKATADVGKTKAETESKQFEVANKRVDAWGQAMGFVRQNPTAENAVAAVQHLVTLKIMPPEQAQAAIAQLGANPTPQAIAQFADMGFRAALSAKDQLATFQTRNTGGTTDTLAIDPVTQQVRTVNSVQNTQSPDNAATNARVAADNAASRSIQWANHNETKRHHGVTEKQQADATRTGKAPAGYRWAADGVSLEAIPGGPAVKSENATEGERKAATLLQRLEGSQKQLEAALKTNPGAAKPELLAAGIRAISPKAEAAANAVTGTQRQQVEAAQLDMLDAALTLGTGAAYTREQLEGYRKSYFPQIGDDQATVADKTARLNNVIQAAKIAAGRAAPKGGADATAPKKIASDAEYNALPSGAEFIAPDGSRRRKP